MGIVMVAKAGANRGPKPKPKTIVLVWFCFWSERRKSDANGFWENFNINEKCNIFIRLLLEINSMITIRELFSFQLNLMLWWWLITRLCM